MERYIFSCAQTLVSSSTHNHSLLKMVHFKSTVLAGMAAAPSAYAWGSLGHTTVAYIAQNLVSQDTKKYAQSILNDTSASYLANVATWVIHLQSMNYFDTALTTPRLTATATPLKAPSARPYTTLTPLTPLPHPATSTTSATAPKKAASCPPSPTTRRAPSPRPSA